MTSLGTLNGTFLVPGASRNRRLYTKDVIADSVADMATRLEAGKPIPMMACHDTNSTLEQVAGIREVWTEEDGRAKYKAEIPDTRAGRDLKALTTPDPVTGELYLNSVSIYGGWQGPTRTVEHEGQQVVTGDKLIITRVDFVDDPGVDAARLDSESAPSPGEAALIEALGVEFTPVTEAAPPAHFHDAPAESAPADPPPGTPAATASAYAQLKALRDKADEAMVAISAFTGDYDTDVNVTSFGVDNGELPAKAARLGQAVDAALRAIDGAADDDTSAPAGPVTTYCVACSGEVGADDSYCSSCGAPLTTGESTTHTRPDRKVTEMAPTDTPTGTPTDGTAEVSATKCGGCGADVSADSKFCHMCGAETKKDDKGGKESAGTQEAPVAETPDLTDQIAAGMSAAFERFGFVPKADEKTTESAPTGDKTTEGAGGSAGGGTTTETSPAGDVSEQISAALTTEREQLAATIKTNNEQLVAGIGKAMAEGFTSMRDELRSEIVEAGGGQRTGQVGGTREDRLRDMAGRSAETDDAPWNTLPAHERDKRHMNAIADQISVGLNNPALAEDVRAHNQYAG